MADGTNLDDIELHEDNEGKGAGFEVSQNFGIMLRHYRTRVRDISLRELAEASQLSTAYINRLERGEKTCPSLPVVFRLAESLDIPYSVLMATTFQPKDPTPQLTLSDVLIQHNYVINGQALNNEAKEMLLKINEFLVSEISWTSKTKNKELFMLLEMIDDFKEAL